MQQQQQRQQQLHQQQTHWFYWLTFGKQMFSLSPMPNWLFPFRTYFFSSACATSLYELRILELSSSFFVFGERSQFRNAKREIKIKIEEQKKVKSQILFYGRLRCCEIRRFTASSNKHQHLFESNKLRVFLFLFLLVHRIQVKTIQLYFFLGSFGLVVAEK